MTRLWWPVQAGRPLLRRGYSPLRFRRSSKWTSLLSLVLVIGLVLSACGGNSSGGQAVRRKAREDGRRGRSSDSGGSSMRWGRRTFRRIRSASYRRTKGRKR
ncbi:hypothetical protein [Paenibacillus thiaminolyticus]|uniref:hypothetical protein n=1 Tax=Paenibacillus thiaminolyticus TaxID=49283 RepID=UPI00398ACEB6